MLLDIFLPEKYNSTRLLSKRIVGCSLSENNVYASLIHAGYKNYKIEKIEKEGIEPNSPANYAQRASTALRTLLLKVGTYDYIRIAIPASIVIFKEISLPLRDPEKIRMVVEYEIEPMLPFAIEEAVVDFIVTKPAQVGKNSQILVAAAKKKELGEVLAIYEQAGVLVSKITVDMFAIYDLYQHIPEYFSLKGGVSLVDVGSYSTKISFIENGKLRLIRNIPKGLSSIIEFIAEDTKLSFEEIREQLCTKGIENLGNNKKNNENAPISSHFKGLFSDIQFTLNAFALKAGFYKDINKIIYSRIGSKVKNFAKSSKNVLKINSELFDVKKILKSGKFTALSQWSNEVYDNSILSLGAALESPHHNEFDLRRKELEAKPTGLAMKQIKAAISLAAFIVFSLGISAYIKIGLPLRAKNRIELSQISKLKSKISSAAKVATDISMINLLQRALRESSLVGLIRRFNAVVSEEKSLWRSLEKLKVNSLQMLSEVTRIIDRDSYNITINELLMSPGDDGLETVEVSGVLRSKIEGEDFRDFAKFEQRLADRDKLSSILLLISSESDQSEEGGVKFSLVFKRKDMEI